MTPHDRFFAKVQRDGGCWLWTGGKRVRVCRFVGCGKPHEAKGFCQSHYLQWREGKELQPLGGSSLTFGMKLEDRFWHYVTKTRTCWLWTGARTASGGYGVFNVGGKLSKAHRFAYELLVGPIPDGLVLDHDNPEYGCGNPACVNPAHLEPVTFAVNVRRQRGLRSTNTSGIHGVSWDAARQRWAFQGMRNGVVTRKRFVNRTDAEEFSRSFHGRVAA